MKTVIFDMDGVLVNTERMHYRAINRTLREMIGQELDWPYYAQFIGSTIPHMWAALERDYGLAGRLDELTEKYFASVDYFVARDGHVPCAGAVDLVRRLHEAGVKLAVASSSPQQMIDEIVHELGLADCFAALISGEGVTHPKPAPDVFLKTAEVLGEEPAACAVIEDSSNGVRAAKAAGMFCIGYRNPDSGAQDLTPCDLVVDRLADAWEGLMAK